MCVLGCCVGCVYCFVCYSGYWFDIDGWLLIVAVYRYVHWAVFVCLLFIRVALIIAWRCCGFVTLFRVVFDLLCLIGLCAL